MNNHVPEKWRSRLQKHIQKHSREDRAYLLAGDFDVKNTVHIKFPDGSEMFLRYAFYIVDETNEEIAIFTEHCGYYFLKTMDLEYKMVKENNL